MKKSVYDASHHVGRQPIRVLSNNISHWFENADKDFKQHLFDEVKYNGLDNGIEYNGNEMPIRDIAFVSSDKKIVIEETFLSYLWIISYVLIVFLDEDTIKPDTIPNYKRTDADKKRIIDAFQLLDLGFKLRREFQKWDISNLPNPEFFDSDENPYILKANGVFLAAVNFVLVHEFAHVYLGHVDLDEVLLMQGTRPTKKDIKDGEKAADSYSIETLLNGASQIANKDTISIGILVGLCALLLLDSSLDGDDHPDPDERIRSALEQINPDKDSYWALACYSFRIWAIEFNVNLGWPQKVNNFRELFYTTLKNLESYGHRI